MFMQEDMQSSLPGVCLFAEIACELTKAWSSGATEFGVLNRQLQC